MHVLGMKFRSDGFIPNILYALQARPHYLPFARCDLRMVLLKTFGMFRTANPFVNLRLVKAILSFCRNCRVGVLLLGLTGEVVYFGIRFTVIVIDRFLNVVRLHYF